MKTCRRIGKEPAVAEVKKIAVDVVVINQVL